MTMTRVVKSITIPLETWVVFDKLHPDLNFSKWVTKRLEDAIAGDIPFRTKTKPLAGTDPNEVRCEKHPRFKGAKPSLQMCSGCGEECELRVG